jgi:predicted permease
MGKLWRRIYFLLNRERLERELADEMAAHREMMPPDRLRNFGSATMLLEDSREVWLWQWVGGLWQDFCYGARVLAGAPGFTLGAVAVLALGVGVNLAEFQIFDAMIFHRLNLRDADVLLHFVRYTKSEPGVAFPHAATEFLEAKNHSFDWLVTEDTSFNVVVEADANQRSCLVSPNYFRSIGIIPAWGRLLDAHDAEPGAAAVAVFGYDYWRIHWAGDPNVIGQVVHINNQPVQIVGVLPYTFDGIYSRSAAIWLPVSLRPMLMTGTPALQQDYSRASEMLFGKLKPGVSKAAGDAELTSLVRELARQQPRSFHEDERLEGNSVQESFVNVVRHRSAVLAIFIVMILLVLLSACANLGNMLLARSLSREREIAIRMAIGAGRARIVRQLMTENLLLALLGAAAGLAFGTITSRLLLVALGAPSWLRLRMDGPFFIAALVLTMLSATAFGLPSALQTVRINARKLQMRQSLIGVQVAVSCLLLIASGVLAHNGILNAAVDLAFDYRNMLVIYPQMNGRNLTPSAAKQKMDALRQGVAALPGVEGITAAEIPPLSGRVRIAVLPGIPHVYQNVVDPSYFQVMQLPVLRGRTFLPGELNAIVVSESAARSVWPGEDPLNKRLTLAGAERSVVGVVKDSGANLLADSGSVEAYLPVQDSDLQASALILHGRDLAMIVRSIPGVAATLKETVTVTLMRASREERLDLTRRMITLFGSVGAVATTLAAAGMFALVAFAVAQRRRELGIRIAIGAGPHQILDVLLRQNIRPMAAGVVVGAILAAILARLVRSMIVLQTRDSVDLTGFAAGLAGFALVAVLATLSPALRALRIDPSTTLREE